MITVEINPESKSVDITVDKDGVELMTEILSELVSAGVEDHIHITSGPREYKGRKRPPEKSALSLEKLNKQPEFIVSDFLTVSYTPK